ncbi:MAG: hypothetical protein KJ576_20910 [Proteobacteria bacterium]|nr:hypothetical protein [Pseudomonadota bacterium]
MKRFYTLILALVLTLAVASPTLAEEWIDGVLSGGGGSGTADLTAIADGDNVDPSIAFATNPRTGLFLKSSTEIGVTIDGSEIGTFAPTGWTGGAGAGGPATTGRFIDGTLADPAESWANDLGMGWYRPASGIQAWVYGGAEKYRLTATYLKDVATAGWLLQAGAGGIAAPQYAFTGHLADGLFHTGTSAGLAYGGLAQVTMDGATVTIPSLTLASGASVTELSSDDTLAGDSETAVPTEGAVKGYVDGRFTALVHADLGSIAGSGAYHFSEAEHTALAAYVTSGVAHDATTGLQGGTTGEYYHLTSAELTTLQGLTKDHESLTGLLGGTTAEHYHFTFAQHTVLTNFAAGGNVTLGDITAASLNLGTNETLNFGDAYQGQLKYNGATYLSANAGNLVIRTIDGSGVVRLMVGPAGGEYALVANPDSSLEAFHNDVKRWETTASGTMQPASTYFNFGATAGTGGYGLWDDAGVIKYKDSAGTWVALNTLGGGGAATWADGTVVNPGQYFTSETQTGISRPAAYTMAFSISGARRFSIQDKVIRMCKGSDTSEVWNSAYYSGLRLGSLTSMYARDDGPGTFYLSNNSYPSTATTQTAIALGKGVQIVMDNGIMYFNYGVNAAAGATMTFQQRVIMDGYRESFYVRNGNFGVGDIGLAMGTTTQSAMGFKINVAPTVGVTDIAMLYAKEVGGYAELMGMDEQGFETQLTAHAFDKIKAKDDQPVPWVWHSQNAYLGQRVDIDLIALAQAVQDMTGKEIISYSDIDRRDWAADQEAAVTAQNIALEGDRRNKVKGKIALGLTEEEAEAAVPAVKLKTVKAPPGWLKARTDKMPKIVTTAPAIEDGATF